MRKAEDKSGKPIGKGVQHLSRKEIIYRLISAVIIIHLLQKKERTNQISPRMKTQTHIRVTHYVW